MNGQGVPWQLPGPQHKAPRGWLRDVTMMPNQSWGNIPRSGAQLPSKPPLWDAQEPQTSGWVPGVYRSLCRQHPYEWEGIAPRTG